MMYLTENAALKIKASKKATAELNNVWRKIIALHVIEDRSGSREMARSAESVVIYGTRDQQIASLSKAIGAGFLAIDRMCGRTVKTTRFLHIDDPDELDELIGELTLLCTTVHEDEDGKKFIFA